MKANIEFGGDLVNGSRLNRFLGEVAGKNARDVVAWAFDTFTVSGVALASSFGVEDQVLTHTLVSVNPRAKVFTLDTGRLFPETYDVMQSVRDTYGIKVDVFSPDADDVRALVKADGPNLFYQSVEKRKACCFVRKVKPLKKALAGLGAWMTGLRRGQGVSRQEVAPVQWDADNGLYKISPLYDWTEDDVWRYVQEHNVPVNRLHAQGFPSVGCAPCTRAVAPGEDPRSGRWWWEQTQHRECGLHSGKGRSPVCGISVEETKNSASKKLTANPP